MKENSCNIPEISIIITIYNTEQYLPKCIESIFSQTYSNFELILVDDGSTDRSGRICDQYGKLDERIHVIHQENCGLAAARNRGIEMAVGKYVFFFDSDDYIEETYLSSAYDCIEKEKAEMVIMGYWFHNNQEKPVLRLPTIAEGMYPSSDIMKKIFPFYIGLSFDNIQKWINGEKNAFFIENPALWRTIVKKELIDREKLRFVDLKAGEDTIFTSCCLSKARSCYILHKGYYHYVMGREDSATKLFNKVAERKINGKIQLLRERVRLNQWICREKGLDTTPFWEGTTLMSALEVIFFAAKRSDLPWKDRKELMLPYLNQQETKEAIKNFKIESIIKPKALPFVLLKHHKYSLLLWAAGVLQRFGYQFSR